MTQEEIISMARETGLFNQHNEDLLQDKEVMAQFERFAALVSAHEAEKWKAENKRDYENWKMAAEKAAECEREAIAQMFDDAPKLMPYAQNAEGGCLTCGFTSKIAAAVIRARGEK